MRSSSSLFLVGLLLTGLLLISGCSMPQATDPGRYDVTQNPLALEAIADQSIEYVTSLQIRANENKKPITDTKVLRAIDETFIKARSLQQQAHERQDKGKRGGFIGKGENYVAGSALLERDALHFGFNFNIDAAPDMRVYLAQHIDPETKTDFMSTDVIDLGGLQSIFGVQTYSLRPLTDSEWDLYKTVVLFSDSLQQVIAISQVRERGAKEPAPQIDVKMEGSGLDGVEVEVR